MSERGEMHADLMCPSCPGPYRQQADLTITFQDRILCHGGPWPDGPSGNLLAFPYIPPDRQLNGSPRSRRDPMDQGQVAAGNRMCLELGSQGPMSRLRLGHD